MADRRSWVEIILMPLVVATVGIAGTHLVTQQQEKNAQTKADADRQVKVLEIFADKITSQNQGERILGLRILTAVDADLAAKLAAAVAEGEPEESQVREVADGVAAEATARARLLPRVYLHIEGEKDRAVAKSVAEVLIKEGVVVPGIERVGTKSPKVSQLRYFRKNEEQEAKRILGVLTKSGAEVKLKYIGGYEDSTSIRPMHFEFWFAAGA